MSVKNPRELRRKGYLCR